MSDEDCANPLLLGWVKEWWATARERNSKGATTYKHAYDSLKACPITFSHPSELQQLRGFGPKLCERLTELLKKHCEANCLPMPKRSGPKRSLDPNQEAGDASDAARPAKKPKKVKAYVPAYRSGAFALVLALATLDEDSSTGLTKSELIELAQPNCDSSFSAPSDPTKFYTAWNSMKTLVQKELVYERGRPLRRYALTDEGWDVAKRIRQTTAGRAAASATTDNVGRPDNDDDDLPRYDFDPRADAAVIEDEDAAGRAPRQPQEFDNVVSDGPVITDDDALPTFTPIRLPPGSFTVHLVLDVREVRAKTDRDYMQEELSKRGVKPIMRSLELGDVLWVAKCHDAGLLARHGAEGGEVVLDWIAERKRLDDLIGSIRDGRFHEQKFRLGRSGIKNVIYLVEEMSLDSQHFQKYEEAVQSAIASTQVVNGYFVKKTQKMDDSIGYLARMTMLLKKQYESKTLHVIPTRVLTAQNYLPLLSHLRAKADGGAADYYISYPAFASLASKSEMMTLRDVFLKMLMCTRGVTGEKALEIQKKWKTPYDFVQAFEQCGVGDAGDKKRKEMVSSQMNSMIGRKKVAKALSQKIAEVWGVGNA